jgi:RNA polymerase sigma factor (TIGR02999 family)
MPSSENDLTGLLQAWSAGDPGAADQLLPAVYEELRRQASRYLARERSDHTLQPTALVNEAYMRLAEQRRVRWQDRGQFFAVAATVMRRLLVDYARQHGASKRGALCTISLDDGEVVAVAPSSEVDVLALNDALAELAGIDPFRARLIELRFFGGLTTEETAAALGVSAATVTRGWRLARAWLHARLTGEGAKRGEPGERSGVVTPPSERVREFEGRKPLDK